MRSSAFPRRFLHGVLALASLGAPGALPAQTAPASRTAPTPAEDAVQLSPFVVATDKDTGYVATSTLAGSRLNTELADTPAAISVFTRDFLEDIGAINVNQAFEYALNGSNDLVESTGNNIVGNDFNYNIRGFRFASAGRNYFGWALSSDSFNIERLDFSRGPNSILFGVGGPGGIVNTTTKQALFTRPITQVSLRLASWDDTRVTFDLNRKLNDRVAVRLNLVRQDAEGYRQWEMTERTSAALALTWRPWRRTTVRLVATFLEAVQVSPTTGITPRLALHPVAPEPFFFSLNPPPPARRCRGLVTLAANPQPARPVSPSPPAIRSAVLSRHWPPKPNNGGAHSHT